MAVTSAQVSVTTTATLLSAVESDDRSGSSLLASNQGAVTVYLGSDSVTTGAGFPLAAGSSMSVDLQPGESLYGIVASGTCTVAVLRVGV